MTLNDRQVQQTSNMAKLIMFAGAKGLLVKVVEWNRLLSTQQEYVAKGVSKTLNSKHLENCATDLYIMVNNAPIADLQTYRMLGEYWESIGGRWGGRFHDAVAWLAAHGVEFDPAKDIGWDPYHFETD